MLNLIPAPSGEVRISGGLCAVPEVVSVRLGGFEPWCTQALGERLGRSIAVREDGWLKLAREDTLPAEGYRLYITRSGVCVAASTEKGVVWALTTLAELCASPDGLVRCAIEDAPKYGHRGLSLDCARHFFTADEVKKIIEQMALTKMNILHWHLVDDQGWRIESRKFPLLHETSGKYYTQDEIREVVEFARVRGVEIIPEIDLPGHTTAVLAAYPQYSCSGEQLSLRETGGIFKIILCAGKEEVFTFLDALLGEICPLFPGERFHIGGDEAPKDEWAKCPHCKARMEAEGLGSLGELQDYFTDRVAALLKKYGKRVVCWNDALEGGELSTEHEVQYWTVQHEAGVPDFLRRGGKVIASDMFALYFDYPYGMSPLRKVYKYRPVIVHHNYEKHRGLVGLEACVWCEQIETPERLENQLFPRLYALAEIAWRDAGDYDDFERRVILKTERAEKQGVCVMPRSNWNPRGQARLEQGVAFLKKMMGPLLGSKNLPTKQQAMLEMMIRVFLKRFFKKGDEDYLRKALF